MKDPRIENWLEQQNIKWDYWEEVPFARIDAQRSLHNQARLDKILDDATVEAYANALKAGDKFPALIAYQLGPREKKSVAGMDLVLITGNHRMAAALSIGQTHFDVYVAQVTSPLVRERLTRTANFFEGRRPTGDEALQHAIWLVERENYTSAAAAQLTQLSDHTVQNALRADRVRSRLMSMGIDPGRIPNGSLSAMHTITLDKVLKAIGENVVRYRLPEPEVRTLSREARRFHSEEEQVRAVTDYAATREDWRARSEIESDGRLTRRMVPAHRYVMMLVGLRNLVERYQTTEDAGVADAAYFERLVAEWQAIQPGMATFLSSGRRRFGVGNHQNVGADHGVAELASTPGG